jgi:N-acetylmuramoyl-L-alanine amidase
MWLGHVRFLWNTGNRLPWVLGAGVGVTMVLFATWMHAMMAGDHDRRELTCLAMNVFYESRGEPVEGQYAVAEVTMNRVANPRYPATVCETVYQKKWDYLRKRYVGAFSWTELNDNPAPNGGAWEQAVSVAEETYSGRRESALDGAVHYHATHIRPSWSRGKKPVARIGQHLFYK